MIGLSRFKRWAITAMFAVIAVAGLSFFPADAVSAGTIQGGKYTVDVKGSKIPLESENTIPPITLTPSVQGTSTSVNDGNIRITNVPDGTYTVTVNFKMSKDLCDKNWVTRIAGLTPAFQAFCKFSGTGDTYFSYQKVFSNVVVRGGTTTLDPPSGNLGSAMQTDANGNPILDCAGKGIIMSFVICPMIENVLGIIDWVVENFIQPYLAINPLTTTTDGKPNELYQIWNNIRNFANVLFILAFFIIVFSQATSIGISNYGIKRLLPRLIIIGIATNISFFICAFLVDVFNVLGVGIASLMVVGVTGGTLTFAPGSVDLFVLLGLPLLITPFGPLITAATSAAIIFGVFVFLFIGAVILFIAAVVILLRQIIIIFLVLASPIAFVAGLLPNTQRYLNQWASAFIKLLAMYPILMAMFAAGKIAATVLQKVGPVGSGNAPDLAVTIMSFMAFVLPLVMVPFAFKFAGSGLHKLYNSMQNGIQRAGSRAANRATGLATRAAKNSAPGQALQEYLNTRRAGSKIKGQELYRRVGTAMPFLNYSQAQKQLFDAQNMKNYQEEVGRARGMMSLNIARSFGDAGTRGLNLEQIQRDGGYNHSTKGFIEFTQEDMNSLRRLDTSGFLKGQKNRAGATAAMDELFDQQFVELSDIKNLSRVAGDDPESSALMTSSIRSAAGRNKYKNYQYGQVVSGSYSKYVDSPKTKDDVSIVQSGTAGVPKEVYEDFGIQAGIAHRVREAATQAAATGNDAILKNVLTDIARQTSDVNKPAIIRQIAAASGMNENDFITLRQAIQTNQAGSTEAQTAVGTAIGQLKADRNRGFSDARVKSAAKEVLDKRRRARAKDPLNPGAKADVKEVEYFDTL